MWIAAKNGNIQIFANNPDQYILSSLKKHHPDGFFFRSKEPCINEVNALLFAAAVTEGDLIDQEEPATSETGEPIMDDEGSPVINRYQVRGPGKVIPCENKARLADGVLIVETKNGDEIARFEVEEVK
jgi:hypothetical protein